MRSVYGFVIKPKGERYKNTSKVGDKELITNTEVYSYQHVNKEAIIVSCPMVGSDLDLLPGDTVIVHHNVFRRWHDVKGRERNSNNFFNEETYVIHADQMFLKKSNNKWECFKGYCFINPIKETDAYSTELEKPNVGVVKYSDGTVNTGDVIGYRPKTNSEFVFEGKRLYRVLSNLITIKYEYQGDEEEYNPSWT
tara:strand:- start:7009 stop:7593 length:585 start_codon:yes stop_codon:yes gene_type:complete